MWELDHEEDWAPKNWCLWTVVLEKTLESPVDSKEIKPVNPKEIKSGYSLEGLTLKLQYFGHLIRRADLLWKASDAGIDWRQEEKGITGWDGWMASPTQWTWVWAISGRWWRTKKPGMLQSMGFQRVRHNLATEQQQQYPEGLVLVI